MREYKRLHPPKPLFVTWRSGDVVLTLFECKQEHAHGEAKVDERVSYVTGNKFKRFKTHLQGNSKEQKLLVIQSFFLYS